MTERFYIPGSLAIAWHKWLAEYHPEILLVDVKEPHYTEVQMWFAEFLHAQKSETETA